MGCGEALILEVIALPHSTTFLTMSQVPAMSFCLLKRRSLQLDGPQNFAPFVCGRASYELRDVFQASWKETSGKKGALGRQRGRQHSVVFQGSLLSSLLIVYYKGHLSGGFSLLLLHKIPLFQAGTQLPLLSIGDCSLGGFNSGFILAVNKEGLKNKSRF